MAESFLGSFPQGLRLHSTEFSNLANLIFSCKTGDDLENVTRAMSRNRSGNLRHIEADAGVKIPPVNTLGLKITDGCNRGCSFCYESAGGIRDEWQLLTIEDLETMDVAINEIGNVNLNGGEPMEHPDFMRICQYLSDNKIPFTLTTTGGDIEQLEQLIPFYQDGSATSLTLSVHGFGNMLARILAEKTAAFFVRHGVPFTINSPVPNINRLQVMDHLVHDLFDLLGCDHMEVGRHKGRVVQNMYTTRDIPRDPSIMLRVVPAFPAGRHTFDQNAMLNAGIVGRSLMGTHGATDSFCTFGAVTVRPDKTVSGCCSALEGKDSGIPRLLDHLPRSLEEITTAMDDYRARMLDRVHRIGNARGILPCLAHRMIANVERG